MKLIHCADLHLGANMLAVLPRHKAEERKNERKNTFLRLVDYAKREGVKGILLSGDVFDTDLPTLSDKAFFLSVVENSPEIVFFVLRGNHDNDQSFAEKKLGNLKTFGKNFVSYDFCTVTIGGVEDNGADALSRVSFRADGKNILLLHGGIEGEIPLDALRGKNIDYLALGHYHSYRQDSLDERGVYCYSGCLDGRGFDECGEKGFVLLDVADRIRTTFIPFASRTIREERVDVSEALNAYEAYSILKRTIDFQERDYYLIHLVGEMKLPFEKEEEISTYLTSDCYYSRVKDETTLLIDADSLAGEMSLQGEFIRLTREDATLSEEDRQQILRYGLMALSGKEVE